jgi:hypothetical protein
MNWNVYNLQQCYNLFYIVRKSCVSLKLFSKFGSTPRYLTCRNAKHLALEYLDDLIMSNFLKVQKKKSPCS